MLTNTDQAMEDHDYAEVLRVADLYRRAGGEPGFKLQAQEIVAGARHAGDPGSALVPLGRLIVEAGPEHEFYHSALRLYAELEREAPHPHYRAPGGRQERPPTTRSAPSRGPMIQWEGERQEMEEQTRPKALPEARHREPQTRALEEQRRREQLEREQSRLAAARAEREATLQRGREHAQRDSHIAEVQAIVERRWQRPEGTRSTDEAVVLVRINPETGQILSYDLRRCSGGEAFCDSVRQTMDRLQTLPRPPDAAAVRGGIRIRFSP